MQHECQDHSFLDALDDVGTTLVVAFARLPGVHDVHDDFQVFVHVELGSPVYRAGGGLLVFPLPRPIRYRDCGEPFKPKYLLRF